MPPIPTEGLITSAILAIGWLGAAVFYGRFYVQWLASEFRKRSVVPIAFWYMSMAGSVMLLIYNVFTRQPGAAFGQTFNAVVYSRNLVHIWREKGRLTRRANIAIHAFAGCLVLVGVIFTALTWLREYQFNQSIEAGQAARNWFWLGIWAVGQALFFLRFLIQWAVTEYKKKSVIPHAFWYLSLAAATLQAASFTQRADWVNTMGTLATLFIYLRNIMLLKRGQDTGDAS